jgi:hypothetical protein
MKSARLLTVCVASAAAMLDSSRPTRVDYGICLSPLLYGSPLSDPVCASDRIVTKFTTETVTKAGDIWTQTSPCFRNGTDDEYCVFHSPLLGGGRGFSIVTTHERAQQIAKSKAFRLSKEEIELRNKMSRKTKVVAIPGKEYGIMAVERIIKGERIISETASLMVDYGGFEVVPQNELWSMQGRGVDFLPHQHKMRFLNMSTHGAELGYLEKIEKILNTNAFDVELDDDEDDNLYAIFAESEWKFP